MDALSSVQHGSPRQHCISRQVPGNWVHSQGSILGQAQHVQALAVAASLFRACGFSNNGAT
eukprot:3625432-Rhodomonas_salina.1